MKTICVVLILTILSSVGFFNPFSLISAQTIKFIFYLLFVISAFIGLTNKKRIRNPHYPRFSYMCLIIGIILSVIMVVAFQKQSLSLTVISTLSFLLPYLYLFVLFKLAIPKTYIIKIITVLCMLGMVIYIINYMTFPLMIFDIGRSEMDEARGIRINIPFIELDVLLFLYAINQYLVMKKKQWLYLISLTAIFIVLSVTRQIILVAFALGILLFLQKVSFIKKLLTLSLLYIFYVGILPQIPLYQNLVELSEEQAEKNKYKDEDIRIQAWRFYTYEYQTNLYTPFFGNGIPSLGKSKWGNKVEKMINKDEGGNACYTVDVGWAGFFWYFGLLTTFGLLSLFIKATIKKKKEYEQYLSYWIIYIILTSITSGPILFTNQILSIVIVLYIIYAPDNSQKLIRIPESYRAKVTYNGK